MPPSCAAASLPRSVTPRSVDQSRYRRPRQVGLNCLYYMAGAIAGPGLTGDMRCQNDPRMRPECMRLR